MTRTDGLPGWPDMPDLPVVEVLEAVRAALTDHGLAILVAPPGAGKTTIVPIALASATWLDGQRLVMLEPRRLATRAAAQRMAALLGERVGETVGYQTRDERVISRQTRIEVVTEGVLTRRLQRDPALAGYGAVIFDEVHERNLPTDLGLAFVGDVRAVLRSDLRMLAMTATPDTKGLLRVLGGDAPVITADGRLHPVEIVYAPPAPRERPAEAMAALVLRAVREQEGDVLAFLPGIGEIRRVQALLAGSLPDTVDVHALAGALSAVEQDLALAPSPPGRRRVVLATDIAESSLTVAGVSVVVDSGLVKVPRLDTGTGMTRLMTVATSRASTDQRAGRAGRTAPGVAYRLWSKLEQGTRRAHLDAEITAVDLAGLALELAAWGTPADRLRWADPPPPRALQQGGELLRTLGALDEAGRITDVGRRMLDLPLHPRLAHMVIAADAADRFLACLLATLLDKRDVLRGPRDELPADLAMRVAVVCRHGDDRADRRDVARVRERAMDLARRARLDGNSAALLAAAADRADRCGRVLALAYPDRLAVRRSQPGRFQLRSGAGAWVPTTDTLAAEPFLVAGDLDGKRDNARIRLGAAMSTADVLAAFADQVETREQMVWDKGRDDLVLITEQRLGGMLLAAHTAMAPPGPTTTAALVERVRATKMAVLRWSEAAVGLRARVAFVRRECNADDWPDWSDRRLIATLDEWFTPYLAAAAGRADIERLDIAMLLTAQLGWDRSQRLAELAPPRLVTPSGREVAVDYRGDRVTAPVRVQDLFGLDSHPCVAGGRLPIVLELLSPADRPLQVTSDLPGFWAGSWSEVRKEMAGRYPKHHWPTDPSKAVPKRLKDR